MIYAAFTSKPANGYPRPPGEWGKYERIAQFASTRQLALAKLRFILMPLHAAGYRLNVNAIRLARCPVWVQKKRKP